MNRTETIHSLWAFAWPAGLAVAGAGCTPPPAVQAVDAWLSAYAAGDLPRLVENTWSGDRDLVRAALEELALVPTGTLATALPPRPISHEILEIESKDRSRGRYVVLVKTTLKNPLPFMSERVGRVIEDMPKTREQRRRFLAIAEGDRFGVKLDLARVLERAAYVARFQRAIARRDLGSAEGMLEGAPPPPDEANALQKTDRLPEALRQELEKARKDPR